MSSNTADILHAPVLGAQNLPWKEICHLGMKMNVGKNFRIDAESTSLDFYYLARGRIRVMHIDASGRERAIFSLGPGNIFNEAPAAAGFNAPDSPFICDTPCQIYRFPHFLLHDPNFVVANPKLIINIMSGLGVKLLILHTSLSNFTGVDAVARVSRFFASLVSMHNKMCLDPAMTQESLSLLLGMNRATLVRVLRELKSCGAIGAFTKHRLEILDLATLNALAGRTGNLGEIDLEFCKKTKN